MKNRKLLTTALVLALSVSSMGMTVKAANEDAVAKNLPEVCDQFVDGENFMWQELDGEHNFDNWYLGFYNFAQIAFQ